MAFPEYAQPVSHDDAEFLFRRAFEHAPIGMAVAALDGTIVDVNRAFTSIVGYDADELGGLHFGELTSRDDLEPSLNLVEQLLHSKGRTFRMEKRYVRASGDVVWVLLCVSLVRDEAGTPRQILVQVVDITEAKRHRERLEELLESKDELISGLSHELRTPIAVVMGSSEELRRRRHHLEPGDIDTLFELILTESVKVSHVVDDFLIAARAQNGTLRVSLGPVSLDKEVARLLRSWAAGGPISADLTPVYTEADRIAVRHVARNLISNAMRHGGGHVEVTVSRRAACGVLRVADEGPGIPEDMAGALFEPHRHRSGDGLASTVGLGLFVVDALCRAMGGSVAHLREGGRTVFEVCLPLADSDSRSRPEGPSTRVD